MNVSSALPAGDLTAGPTSFAYTLTNRNGVLRWDYLEGRLSAIVDESDLSLASWDWDGDMLCVFVASDADKGFHLAWPAMGKNRRFLDPEQLWTDESVKYDYRPPIFAKLSPDGRHVAFCRSVLHCSEDCELCLASTKTGSIRTLRLGGILGYEVAWSRDSSELCITGVYGIRSEPVVAVVALASGAVRRFPVSGNPMSPDWGSHGIVMAVAQERPELYGWGWEVDESSLVCVDPLNGHQVPLPVPRGRLA